MPTTQAVFHAGQFTLPNSNGGGLLKKIEAHSFTEINMQGTPNDETTRVLFASSSSILIQCIIFDGAHWSSPAHFSLRVWAWV